MAMMYGVPHHSPWIFLYYPLRLKDVLQRHIRTAWSLYRGDTQTHSRAERQAQINALKIWLLSE